MPFVSECARYNHDTGNVGTITQNFTAGVGAGKTIVFFANAPLNIAVTGWTITDTKGNTWVAGPTIATTPANYQMASWVCKVTTAITTSDTYTVTVTGANPVKWCILAAVFDDITAATIDASGTNSSTAVSSLTVSTTAATTQAQELVVAAFAFTDSSGGEEFSRGTGFSAVGGSVIASPTATPRALAMEYNYVTATGTKTATAGLTQSEAYGAIVITLKQVVAAVVVRRIVTASGYTALTTRIA